MDPCELNIIISSLTNYLYTSLSKKDFAFLNVFISELGKSMFAMELLRGVCQLEDKHHKP